MPKPFRLAQVRIDLHLDVALEPRLGERIQPYDHVNENGSHASVKRRPVFSCSRAISHYTIPKLQAITLFLTPLRIETVNISQATASPFAVSPSSSSIDSGCLPLNQLYVSSESSASSLMTTTDHLHRSSLTARDISWVAWPALWPSNCSADRRSWLYDARN